MSLLPEFKKTLREELTNGNFTKPGVTLLIGLVTLASLNRRIRRLIRLVKVKKPDTVPHPRHPYEPPDEEHQEHHHSHSHSHSHGHQENHHYEEYSNQSFIINLRKILPLMIPRWVGGELMSFAMLGVLLIARTGLSSIIADLSGKAAGYIVSKRADLAVKSLAGFIVFTVPASFINSLLKYFTAKLSILIRNNLTGKIHDLYLKDVTFYNIVNLKGDEKKIDDVAERITVDIQHFSDEVGDIFISVLKPIMDILFFTYKMSQSTSWRGPFILYFYFLVSSLLKSMLAPPLGKLNAMESELQGDFRSVHERLMSHSEEVAFYDGSKREKNIINNKLDHLNKLLEVNMLSKLFLGVIDNLIIKYWATLAGYSAIFSPILFGLVGNKSASELAEDYARNSRYLANLSEAIGSLVLLGNKVNELKGHVERIGEVLTMLNDVSQTKKKKAFQKKPEVSESVSTSLANDSFLKKWKSKCDDSFSNKVDTEKVDFVGGVKITEGDYIQFKNIDIVSPEGKVLVEGLSFEVHPNQNVMVTGPNGSGKSSLFRIIGDLWPPSANPSAIGGDKAFIVKPKKKDIVFIPQKTYLVLGPLRDQIIYPHDKAEMKLNGVTDEDLTQLLRIVDPKQVILSTWKLDDEKDWFHALSGGQKQRIAMARLFYHRPRFAILDECTSAVSDEVEDFIYQAARALGITLFTVSHREYLKKHHEYLLTFEGREGKWGWEKI